MSENGKPHLCWVHLQQEGVANALGYTSHHNAMKKYSERYITFDNEAPVALTIIPADHFRPIEGKKNILFTMWEFLDIPKVYIDSLKKADYLVVPSAFCRDLFKKHFEKPIYVCWEGIEPEKFPFYQRKFPDHTKGEKFRFLWLGAPNARKGYQLVLEATKLAEECPQWEIYIKTTASKKTPWNKYPRMFFKRILAMFNPKFKETKRRQLKELYRSVKRMLSPHIDNKLQVFGKHKNIIFDTRKLPENELTELYNSAHCFLHPTMGEGWGLTLCEAMATGCPCISTNVTGVREFFNAEVGYEIDYKIDNVDLRDYYKLETRGYLPDTKNFVEKMIYVYQHYYGEALHKGKKASERIHSRFTWDKSGQRLAEIIKEIKINEKSGLTL
jgi:glycosyltransferase involved in cell wall biosynthesis